MVDLLRLAAFAVFLVLGFRIAWVRAPERRRTAVNLLLLYVLGLSGVVVLSQRDAWPFSVYSIATGRRLDRAYTRIEIRGLDADQDGKPDFFPGAGRREPGS